MALVSVLFFNSTSKMLIIFLFRLFSSKNSCSCNTEFSQHFDLHSIDRLVFSEAIRTVCGQKQHYGLQLPPVQLERKNSAYETRIKCKVLLLEEYECCEMESPDSCTQDNRDVKEQLAIDDSRLVEMKKIYLGFLNPI